jgi:hypothetical protein
MARADWIELRWANGFRGKELHGRSLPEELDPAQLETLGEQPQPEE